MECRTAGRLRPCDLRPPIDQLFAPERIVLPIAALPGAEGEAAGGAPAPAQPTREAGAGVLPALSAGAVRVSVPLEISIALGTIAGAPNQSMAAPPELAAAAEEAIRIDPDYGNRRGYDEGFLDGGGARVPQVPLEKRVTSVDAFLGRVSGFRLCEPVRGRIEADLVLTLCNA
jgi:hypothetical protein